MEQKDIILDVGGIIIRDDYDLVAQILQLSPREARALRAVLYGTPLFQDLMLGYLSQTDYAYHLATEFPNYREQILTVFLPENAPKILPIIPENLQYVKQLAANHRIFFLSNMSDGVYAYLKDTLSQFSGGAYSFREHVKKPDADFYQILLSRYNLLPENCLFFDDKKVNVQSARALGLKAHVFNSLKDLQKDLQKEPPLL